MTQEDDLRAGVARLKQRQESGKQSAAELQQAMNDPEGARLLKEAYRLRGEAEAMGRPDLVAVANETIRNLEAATQQARNAATNLAAADLQAEEAIAFGEGVLDCHGGGHGPE